MVRVQGAKTAVGVLPDFFIDRYEVTNRQYKDFVNNGGYRDQKYWKHKFMEDGEELTWQQAMTRFVDRTGQPGPSTWEAGDCPEGQDKYPESVGTKRRPMRSTPEKLFRHQGTGVLRWARLRR